LVYHTIRYAPSNKVQLCDGRGQTLELDALGSAKRVEELFGITIQTRFIRNVNCENFASRILVRDVSRLRVIGHEPLQVSERYTLSMSQDVVQLLVVVGLPEKFTK
jgi:hypothetical protein